MKIRLYDSVEKLPGDIDSELSDVFLTMEKLMEEESDSELRDCLRAILEINLHLTAHVYINRKPSFFDGSEIRILMTTSSVDGKGVIWGGGYDHGPEGGPYIKKLHVDTDLSKVAEHARHEYGRKSHEEWKKFFVDIFEAMRKKKLEQIESAQKLLTFLQPV